MVATSSVWITLSLRSWLIEAGPIEAMDSRQRAAAGSLTRLLANQRRVLGSRDPSPPITDEDAGDDGVCNARWLLLTTANKYGRHLAAAGAGAGDQLCPAPDVDNIQTRAVHVGP